MSGKKLEKHTCSRCGKEIKLDSKCFVKTFRNKAHEPRRYTSYHGTSYTVQRPPSPLTRLSIGLCEGCVSEVEAIIYAWCRGGQASAGAYGKDGAEG